VNGPLETPRVIASPAALVAVARLVGDGGPVLFFISGGCCDGSTPMCFREGEFKIGEHDALVGRVLGCPVYIDARQARAWGDAPLVLDVGAGEPEGFSLPAGVDGHFVIRPPTTREERDGRRGAATAP
jgi:uncharacterized protein (DUF779 family)